MQINTLFPISRKLWWSLGGVYVATMLWLSLSPSVASAGGIPHGDKVLHACAHFALCSWFFPLLNRKSFAYIVLSSALLGLLIECLQFFSPGRMPDVWDLLANVVGALLAALLMRGEAERLLRSLIVNNSSQPTHDVF